MTKLQVVIDCSIALLSLGIFFTMHSVGGVYNIGLLVIAGLSLLNIWVGKNKYYKKRRT